MELFLWFIAQWYNTKFTYTYKSSDIYKNIRRYRISKIWRSILETLNYPNWLSQPTSRWPSFIEQGAKITATFPFSLPNLSFPI